MTITRNTAITGIAAVVVLLALGAAGGYWWAHRAMSSDVAMATSAASADPPAGATETTDKRKVLYWHDPMVPNQKFDKPGKSPFMDMQLVPVYADDAGWGGNVRVSSSAVQNLGIRLGKVEKVALSTRLRAVGSVAFDERLLELVQSRVEGYITRLYVKAPLEHVRRGQPLAAILAPQWQEAEQEYLALLDASSARAQAMRDAARQRLIVLGVPEPTIRAVETTHKTSATTTVTAPIDGVVTELGVREGASFMSGASLFRINGLATVWVNAQIPEAKVSMVPLGSAVEAHATGWPGTTFKGQVIALLPQVDPMTRTLTARIALENPERKLSPGMFVALDFSGAASEPQLVVPSEALIATGERTVVVVARDGEGFDVVNVSTGAEQDGRTAILSGLTEGQSIVVSGQFLIDSEASLKSTVNRLGTAAAPMTTDAMSPSQESTGSAAPASHLTRGTITAITPEAITIAHEPVPSLQWPAMTMGFKPPARGIPKDLKVGDRVSFSFAAREGGSFQLESVATLDPPAAPEQKP
jgi:membrane fusion protein, copper/silver efflux system